MGTEHRNAATGRDRPRRPASSLVRWRRAQLRRVGFDGDLADTVAADLSFDLHALIELVERGCPPMLALRIVAPIREDDPAPIREDDPC